MLRVFDQSPIKEAIWISSLHFRQGSTLVYKVMSKEDEGCGTAGLGDFFDYEDD